MKFYARVASVEKKQVTRENAQGKRESKTVHVAKFNVVGGPRFTMRSDEPFEEFGKGFTVASTIAVTLAPTQSKLPSEEEAKEAKA